MSEGQPFTSSINVFPSHPYPHPLSSPLLSHCLHAALCERQPQRRGHVNVISMQQTPALRETVTFSWCPSRWLITHTPQWVNPCSHFRKTNHQAKGRHFGINNYQAAFFKSFLCQTSQMLRSSLAMVQGKTYKAIYLATLVAFSYPNNQICLILQHTDIKLA